MEKVAVAEVTTLTAEELNIQAHIIYNAFIEELNCLHEHFENKMQPNAVVESVVALLATVIERNYVLTDMDAMWTDLRASLEDKLSQITLERSVDA